MKRLVLLLFFLSGAFGLVYEVVWTRLLTHVLGTTALAVGTVLAAFMSGLAVGSRLFGRIADRSPSPLRLYALLEAGIGLAALAAHLLLLRIEPIYVALYGLSGGSGAVLAVTRFGLAFVTVMAPTILMGATLPVLVRFCVRSLPALGPELSSLYAVNTFGAVAGSLAAGFLLIGTLGLHGAVAVPVAGNLAVAAIAWALASRSGPATSGEAAPERAAPAPGGPPPADEGTPAPPGLILGALALSGLTSFAYEIYWTRSLVFLLGSSTYAVTTMLATFLTGIALGGWIARFPLRRWGRGAALFGWVQILIGTASALALPALFAAADFASVRITMGAAAGDPQRLFLTRFGLSALVMLLPATLIGMTFPLAGHAVTRSAKRAGEAVGRAYAFNTAGNVAGALLPGLFLLELLGIQRGILAMALLNLAAGAAVLLAGMRRRAVLTRLLPAGAAAAAVMVLGAPLDFRFPAETQAPWHRVLYYREGPSATTMVLLEPDTRELSMSVDGIDIGGTGFTDFKQQLLAHLPNLLMDAPARELSIGLGSGILAGESARHRDLESITAVEIEPSVVEGAAWFHEANHGILEEPRLRLEVDDVSSFLRTRAGRYEVISADEKTAQEYASNGFSYSREYYALLRGALAPEGLVAQWVPTTLPPRQYRMILRTFAEAFPHVQLWFFPAATQNSTVNTILVGSLREIPVRREAVSRRLEAGGGAFRGLARYGLSSADAVLPHLTADREAILEAVGEAPENTVIHPRYEFYLTKDFAPGRMERFAETYGLLAAMRERALPRLFPSPEPSLAASLEAEEAFLAADRRAIGGAPPRENLVALERVLARDPDNPSLQARIGLRLAGMAYARSGRGDLPGAVRLLTRALEVHGRNPMDHVNLALMLGRTGRPGRGIQAAGRAVAMDPDLVAGHRVLAQLLVQAGRPAEAVPHLRTILEIEPGDPGARQQLSRLGASERPAGRGSPGGNAAGEDVPPPA